MCANMVSVLATLICVTKVMGSNPIPTHTDEKHMLIAL